MSVRSIDIYPYVRSMYITYFTLSYVLVRTYIPVYTELRSHSRGGCRGQALILLLCISEITVQARCRTIDTSASRFFR